MRPSCCKPSNRSWATRKSSRRRSVEHLLEERSATPQPVLVNRMPYAGASQRLDRATEVCQRPFCRGERPIRNEGIVGAVNEERARTRAQLTGQEFGSQQPP